MEFQNVGNHETYLCLLPQFFGGRSQFSIAEGRYTKDTFHGAQRQGIGKYTKVDGSVLAGQWIADTLSGPQCYVVLVSQKIKYKGGMRDGKYHGYGVYRGPEGFYEGGFRYGK